MSIEKRPCLQPDNIKDKFKKVGEKIVKNWQYEVAMLLVLAGIGTFTHGYYGLSQMDSPNAKRYAVGFENSNSRENRGDMKPFIEIFAGGGFLAQIVFIASEIEMNRRKNQS